MTYGTQNIDFTEAVTSIDELHRRSFSKPVDPADWARHNWERDLNIKMLNDGDIEDMPDWVFTSEDVKSFINSNWVLRDSEGVAARLSNADGSEIYVAPVGDRFITWLDKA